MSTSTTVRSAGDKRNRRDGFTGKIFLESAE
jgi:hypothetical protein